ncbi:MAG: hypothetical protein RMJ43_07445 [Chloroherpetonaceae bacterium]|nr:hypothetical protein [Chthonomonadaceae bacterium]MDW8207656.1 hypothetical protein [Chloroherpetonaceae bacterium]
MRAVVWLVGSFWFCLTLAGAGAQTPLLSNSGFEGGVSDGRGGGVPGWNAFGQGYTIDRNTFRNGEQSIRCDSVHEHGVRGAQAIVTLQQTHPTPVLVSGWSRADAVGGQRNSDYALYVDVRYVDGTHLWGQAASFRVGTHDWERRQVLILPTKPIATLYIYALFRYHRGTVWFDDFNVRVLDQRTIFDSQVMSPLPGAQGARDRKDTLQVRARDGLELTVAPNGAIVAVRAGGENITSTSTGGLFLRDVREGGGVIPLRGPARPAPGGGVRTGGLVAPARVAFTARIVPQGESLHVDGEVTDRTGTDRAVTIYLAIPIQAIGWQWGQDIRRVETIVPGREYTYQARLNVGATGGISLYPCAAISGARHVIGIANQMDWPGVFRLFYNATTRHLVIAWDFALTGKTAAWPAHNARFRCTLFRLPSEGQPAQGFRRAVERFYRLNALHYRRRATAEGIWIPFTDPATVQAHADFHFAYHEGDNSIKSDDALGILSFRYTEPMTFWMNLPATVPRTYDAAIAYLKRLATGEVQASETDRQMAQATLYSGVHGEDGRFYVEFRKEPWADGALFCLNPNPELPHSPDRPTRARLAYNPDLAERMYGPEAREARGELDGEYLDSLEGWSDVLDYRPEHLAASPYPLPFETDTLRPVLPQWYSTHTFTRFLSNEMRRRGKLLMANATPVRFSIFAPLLDVMGVEVNWLDAQGRWHPDDDAIMCLRRTLSGRKPYLLLMNTRFDRFTPDLVEKYFQRCLFYAIYPSMFSHNAAEDPYWGNPEWYNRDRPLFRRYIPIIRRLSAAGWEPVTRARSINADVYVERFGNHLFTLFNPTGQPQQTTLEVDLRAPGMRNTPSAVLELLSGQELPMRKQGERLMLSLTLQPEQVACIELR